MKNLALIALLPVLLFGFLYALGVYLWFAFVDTTKAWTIAYQVDELGNVSANGKENTTISARAARARNAGRRWGCVLCKILNWFQKDHCDKALS
ncbi:hypothetical protein DVT68_01250 [Dyella solisilvae]|uniref:Uncharacterized protein n=1 Tax=Dyella solisilvae TaxID=1920168 RepID=A0A370KA53_9GAMM|nr:hypothetical protein [Dyella solisilvae]RDI99515.1 hypothetical protein DVT68_01250 [Dyella solisilvae]